MANPQRTTCIGYFLAAVSMAFVAVACNESPTEPSPVWSCTLTLDAEDFTRTVTGSATATARTREAAEQAARQALCTNDELDLSSFDEQQCLDGRRPVGFTSWRLESNCTTG